MSNRRSVINFASRLDRGFGQSMGKKTNLLKFERARDGEGQFAPQSGDGGVDAATMTAAYGHPAERQTSHAAGKAAVAMGSGAAAVLLGRRLRAAKR